MQTDGQSAVCYWGLLEGTHSFVIARRMCIARHVQSQRVRLSVSVSVCYNGRLTLRQNG